MSQINSSNDQTTILERDAKYWQLDSNMALSARTKGQFGTPGQYGSHNLEQELQARAINLNLDQFQSNDQNPLGNDLRSAHLALQIHSPTG